MASTSTFSHLFLTKGNSGADHNSGVHDIQFTQPGSGMIKWNTMDYKEPIISTELGSHKARLLYQMNWTRVIGHFLGMCNFIDYSPDQIVTAVRAATGWPMSVYRLFKTVERSITLCRIFNLREGFTDKDDRLPKRFEDAMKEGAIKGIGILPDKLEETKKTYYQMLGWDEKGIPTAARLAELDIEWAKAYLPDN